MGIANSDSHSLSFHCWFWERLEMHQMPTYPETQLDQAVPNRLKHYNVELLATAPFTDQKIMSDDHFFYGVLGLRATNPNHHLYNY
jgi:hypothetical protein